MSDSNSTFKFCKRCNAETERHKCGACKLCAKANDAAWRAKNPERKKANNAAWQKANPERNKANREAWLKANPGKMKAMQAAWYLENTEKANAYGKSYRAENPEKVRVTKRSWIEANPNAGRVYNQNRRASLRANGGVLSRGLLETLFKLQKGKCACCGQPLGDNAQLDHIMPIALGGSNTDDNIQLLRSFCNNQKHARHPVDFMQSRGFLL